MVLVPSGQQTGSPIHIFDSRPFSAPRASEAVLATLWAILHAKAQHALNIEDDDEDENDYESRGTRLLAPRF